MQPERHSYATETKGQLISRLCKRLRFRFRVTWGLVMGLILVLELYLSQNSAIWSLTSLGTIVSVWQSDFPDIANSQGNIEIFIQSNVRKMTC